MVIDPQNPPAGDEMAQLFPDLREAGETTLRQCQLVLIRMLKIFDHICRAEDISYWMTAGTLIGALRHRGMIPWDCDIDIAMTREAYDAFKKVAHRLPADIFFQNRHTDPESENKSVEARLRDRYSNYYDWLKIYPQDRQHNGLQIDILLYGADAAGHLINPLRKTPYERDEIFPLSRIEFEGAMLLAPNNPGRYISRRYGDYMKIPSWRERMAHEGRADPFCPCDHHESRPYPRKPPVTHRDPLTQRAQDAARRLLNRVLGTRK